MSDLLQTALTDPLRKLNFRASDDELVRLRNENLEQRRIMEAQEAELHLLRAELDQTIRAAQQAVEHEQLEQVTIRVWHFEAAPQKYQDLSEHGGDEDWLAFVPAALADEWISWLQQGSHFGCCDVSEHSVPGGVVRIGAHG